MKSKLWYILAVCLLCIQPLSRAQETSAVRFLKRAPELLLPLGSWLYSYSLGLYDTKMNPVITKMNPLVKDFLPNLQWPAALKPSFYIDSATRVMVKAAGEQCRESLIQPVIEDVKKVEEKLEKKIDETKGYVEKTARANFLYATGAFIGCGMAALGFKYAWNKLNARLYRPVLNYEKVSPRLASDKCLQKGGIGFEMMVFDEELKKDLDNLIVSTGALVNKKSANHSDNSHFTNLLLKGPSGLGKRTFVQELALFSGMDFYEIKTSSLVNFKQKEASQALSDFFNGVKKGSRCAVIYIDDASVLFSKYNQENPNDIGRMVQAFIEETNKRSSKFMLVVSVTDLHNIKTHMLSVFDIVLEFKKPNFQERQQLLKLYRDHLFTAANPDVTGELAQKALEVLDEEMLLSLAKRFNGATAAEIASLMQAIKAEALYVHKGNLSKESVEQVVARRVLKYNSSWVLLEKAYNADPTAFPFNSLIRSKDKRNSNQQELQLPLSSSLDVDLDS